jgi:hypothetical protein
MPNYSPGAGGGGSGGAIWLQTEALSITGTVSAAGGAGGLDDGVATGDNNGGAGGVGRVRLDTLSIAGSTTPAAGYTTTTTFNAVIRVNSDPVTLNLQW